MNSVCNNVLFELYRSHSRVDPLGDDTGGQIRDTQASAEETVAVDEERALVRKVLATLPAKEKQLLEWLFSKSVTRMRFAGRLASIETT